MPDILTGNCLQRLSADDINLVCLCWFFTSQSIICQFVFLYLILFVLIIIFQLCPNMSSWAEPALSKDKCVLNNAVRLEPATLRYFSVMSGRVFPGWTSTKHRIKWLAQAHYAVPPVRLKHATARSRVKHSTTEPPGSSWHIPEWQKAYINTQHNSNIQITGVLHLVNERMSMDWYFQASR